MLLEIMNPKLRKKENKDNKLKGVRFLLQIWSDTGTMIYERKLSQPILSWCLQHDILFFKTKEESDKGIVKLYAVKCFKEEPPNLITFNFPQDHPIHQQSSQINLLGKSTQQRVRAEIDGLTLNSVHKSMVD